VSLIHSNGGRENCREQRLFLAISLGDHLMEALVVDSLVVAGTRGDINSGYALLTIDVIDKTVSGFHGEIICP